MFSKFARSTSQVLRQHGCVRQFASKNGGTTTLAAKFGAASASSSTTCSSSSSTLNSASNRYQGRQFSTTASFDEPLVDDDAGKNRADSARPSYLDYQATTPMDPRVVDAMLPFLTSRYGNPHSSSHVYGWDADTAVEESRLKITNHIGAGRKEEVIFTSGATESNNMAIKGVAAYYDSQVPDAESGKERVRTKKHMITTETEHKCVLASCRELSSKKDLPWDITYLPVKQDGIVDLEVLKAAIRPDTALVSVMFVNNEIGVRQPIEEIGKMCAEKKILFHTDAAQAIGKVPINVDEMNISLMSISGHKVYGPKGIGALYARKKKKGPLQRVRMKPLIDGGGQEFGLRSGTLPAPLCVGLGTAVEVCAKEMENDKRHIARLAKRMRDRINEKLEQVILNGSEDERYIGNLNLSFAGVEGESLLMALSQTMSVSSGSACTSASLEPSYVLRALNVDEEMAHTSLRFGIGRFTTDAEIDEAVDVIVTAVNRLRDMSPLWDMYLEEKESGFKSGVKWS